MDLEDQDKYYRKQAIISRCGGRFNNENHVLVEYLENVPGHSRVNGKAGEQKWIHKDYYHLLEKEKKVKKIKNYAEFLDEIAETEAAKQKAREERLAAKNI
jgi:hypothetical protein